ncbi:MAG: hypothetical protein J6039_04595 [Alphaproteobacteria bacterium]|nr:hypothetical protein [Alphaproteobacteria bacterium]
MSYTLPAPVKGLNCRDGVADMGETYAVTMDNYIPRENKVVLRKGYQSYVVLNGDVKTLAAYNAGRNSAFFAIAGGKVFNISNKSDVYEYDNISLTNSDCRTAQYKNYMYFVNGVDAPLVYYVDENNDEHFGAWGFSAEGLTEENIVNVSVSKQRLWFVEKNSLKVWYPEDAGNISGTLSCFDLAQVSRFGGRLVAVANWTQDGGQGIDDLTVFITSEGEALVYSGSDINDAEDWKLRGSYKISRPIGYNCTIAYQGDVVIITEDGYLPLSTALPADKANASQLAFSDTIRGLVLDRTQRYSGRSGWQGIIYSRGNLGIFNIPVANQFEQHVICINNGAWCRFTGIRSFCWGEYETRLYFGSSNGVFLFDEGYSDNGTPISGVVEQAYSSLGTEYLKKIQLLNPRTKSLSAYSLVIYTNMDMEQRQVDYEENIGQSGVTRWNTCKWSSFIKYSGTKWESSGSSVLRSQWIANSSVGYKAGIVFKTKTKGNSIEWYETGIRYETGVGIL